MRANELRIGNYVKFDDRVFRIYSLSEDLPTLDTIEFGIGVVDWNNLKPIELTEEWLVKFGFQKYPDMFYGDFRFEIHFGNRNKSITLSETFELYNGIYSQQIEFIHQLQNLYFALTGTELTIKQS